MQREDWKFQYTGKQLQDAALAKVNHHKSRYA